MPPTPEPDYEKLRIEREYERIIAESPEEKLVNLKPVRQVERSYFTSKRNFPDKDESFHLFSALKTACERCSDEKVQALAARCVTLDDAMIQAVRLHAGGPYREKSVRCAREPAALRQLRQVPSTDRLGMLLLLDIENALGLLES